MAGVGIVTALGFEARTLGRGPRFTIRRCGVAGRSLEEAVRELRDAGCDLIVSWGTAGALSPRLKAGDLYLPEDILTRRGVRLAVDAEWRARFAAAAGVCPLVSGTLLDSPAIVTEPREKHRLLEATGAGAVDMESGPMAEACVSLGLSFLAIRGIIDEARDRLPEQIARSVTATGSLRATALAARLVLSPGQWPVLARLMRGYRRATSTLALAAGALASCAEGKPGP